MHQRQSVQIVQKTFEMDGDLQNIYLEHNQVIKELEKAQVSLGRKTLAKTIAAFTRYQTYVSLHKWLDVTR